MFSGFLMTIKDTSYPSVKSCLKCSNRQDYTFTFSSHSFTIRKVINAVHYSLLLILGYTKDKQLL